MHLLEERINLKQHKARQTNRHDKNVAVENDHNLPIATTHMFKAISKLADTSKEELTVDSSLSSDNFSFRDSK